MSAASTEKTFRIAHINSGQGVFGNANNIVPSQLTEIPCYPTNVSASSNIVSKSFNDLTADFYDIPISNKLKVIWKFEGVEVSKALALINDLIFGRIKGDYTFKTRKFAINTWTPLYGWVKGYFYLGTPTQFDMEGVAANNEGATIDFELHWIEVGDPTTHLNAIDLI